MTAPTPTNLKLLRGNPGKRAINHDEPQYIIKIPTPPKEFTKEQKALYRKIGRQLKAGRVITEIDGHALATYVEMYTEYKRAVHCLAVEGYLIETPNGMKMQSPYVSIKNKAYMAMRQIWAEFGMTPSSRTRIKALPDTKTTSADPWGNI